MGLRRRAAEAKCKWEHQVKGAKSANWAAVVSCIERVYPPELSRCDGSKWFWRPWDDTLCECRSAQLSRTFTCKREPAGPGPSTCPLSVDTSIMSATACDITSTAVSLMFPLACKHECLLNQCLEQAEFAISGGNLKYMLTRRNLCFVTEYPIDSSLLGNRSKPNRWGCALCILLSVREDGLNRSYTQSTERTK